MASAEAGGGARVSQPPWVALVVGGGHVEAGLRAPPRVAPGASRGPAAAADTAAGATVGRAQAPQRADALDGGPEARLLPLLLDDIQQEVEVVTEEATVPQQDEEMGGGVEAGAEQGPWCAWPQEVLLRDDTVRVVHVVSDAEAARQRRADEGPWLQVQLMEGVERHGMELLLPLEGMSQLVGAVSDGVHVGAWAEWAPWEYGGPEEEGAEHRDGQRQGLEVHDNIQVIQLVSVLGHMEGWEERVLSEDGDLEQWGEEEEQMAKDDEHREEDDDEDEDEGEEDWNRQQELLEVHDSVCVVRLAAEPGPQECWEEWAFPEDGDVNVDEAEDEYSEGQQQILEMHVSDTRSIVRPGSPAWRRTLTACAASAHQKRAAPGVPAKPKCLQASPTGHGDPIRIEKSYSCHGLRRKGPAYLVSMRTRSKQQHATLLNKLTRTGDHGQGPQRWLCSILAPLAQSTSK